MIGCEECLHSNQTSSTRLIKAIHPHEYKTKQKKQKKNKNDFRKHLFKLKNNSGFGKTMQNVRNQRDVKLATSERSS